MPNSAEIVHVNNQKRTPSTNGYVSLADLAKEFGKDFRAIKKWLLQYDIPVSRRAVLCQSTGRRVAVLTETEARQARYLRQHGVLLQKVSR
jgi:hypothetical protein